MKESVRVNIRLTDEEELLIKQYMEQNMIELKSEACRLLMKTTMNRTFTDEQLNLVALVVKDEVGTSFKRHSRRIRAILYHAGRLSSIGVYFLLSVYKVLVPSEKRKKLEILYEEASKFAVKEIRKTINEEGE